MAEISPLEGIIYNEKKAGDISQLVAPPYDVVSALERDGLIKNNPFNIFTLELPQDDPEKGENSRFAKAAETYNDWLNNEILVREPKQAIYPYEITFELNGHKISRKGMIAKVKVEDWADRVILPHEKTFNKVTEERLNLFRSTQAQFSQIFLIHKQNRTVKDVLEAAISDDNPLISVTDSFGNLHRIWRLDDPEKLAAITRSFEGERLYIADGHHRYTTAISYRKEMEALHNGQKGPYSYVASYLVDATDPGLVVLPTHRILSISNPKIFAYVLKCTDDDFEKERLGQITDNTLELLEKKLKERADIQGFGFINGETMEAELWFLKNRDILKKTLGMSECLAQLDVVCLEELVIKQFKGLQGDIAVSYNAFGDAAIKKLSPDQVMFFLRPTPVKQVLDVADYGFTMPHKATFFYPKILTGLVINPL